MDIHLSNYTNQVTHTNLLHLRNKLCLRAYFSKLSDLFSHNILYQTLLKVNKIIEQKAMKYCCNKVKIMVLEELLLE